MKLKKDEYYWVIIDGLEIAKWDGHSWDCIGRDYSLKEEQVKPIKKITKLNGVGK